MRQFLDLNFRYELFDATTEDVEKIAMTILKLYSYIPKTYAELNSKVEILRNAKKKQLKDSTLGDDSPFQSGNNSPGSIDLFWKTKLNL